MREHTLQKRKYIGLVSSTALVAVSLLLTLSDCSTTGSIAESNDKIKAGDIKHIDPLDPNMNLSRDDYRHLAAPKSGEAPVLKIQKDVPPIPKLADILAAPRPPKIGETQLVSIAVTDDVPLKDVLLELAKLADIDIELDAGITGGVEFIAKDKPFNEVIDRIADLAGLRYTMKNNVLRVERDTPYIKSYSIDFLNMDRDSDSTVNLSTNVLSTAVGGSGGGSSSALNTGSTSSVKSKTSGDFWKSLETGVQQILAFQAPDHASATTLQAETDNNALTAMTGMPQGSGAGGAAGAAGSAVGGANAASGVAGGGVAKGAAPVGAGAGGGAGGAAVGGAAQANNSGKSNYTINRQAGVLTLNGSSRQHELMERFLDALKRSASSQVLIEAKIIEVDLQDQYASGIDWQVLGTKLGQEIGIGAISTSFPLGTPANSIIGSSSFATFTSSSNTNNILKLIEGFGTTRTLSSPRLHAINNQQSTLTFAENHVYFTLAITAPTTTTTGTVTTTPTAPTITSTIQTVPIGVMMTIMPSIDLKNNQVTLAVRPTLSTIIDTVNDPAFDLTVANVVASISSASASSSAATALITQLAATHNQIPEVQVRELDSTLKLKSGDTMVIGGLMQQEATNNDQGVPFVNSLPVVGNLFKSVTKSSHNKELVLLIKASIVDSGGSLNPTDKNIFHKFSDDPRPVSF